MNAKKIKMTKAELRKKEYQLAFHELVLDIAFKFMMVDGENFNQKVDFLLEKLGKFVKGERTYLFTIIDNEELIYTHEWCNENVKLKVEPIKNKHVDLSVFPWWQKQLEKNQAPYYIEDTHKMSVEASQEADHLKKLGIKSTISVPILVDHELYGFIGIDSIKTVKSWTDEDIDILQALAKIISSGIHQKNAAQRINYMAYHDQLTGLANTHLLQIEVEKTLNQAKENDHPFSVLFMDLDEFKKINDSLGHQEGDHLLKRFAERLLKIVNKDDLVSRRGGDEFIILLRNYNEEAQLDQLLAELVNAFKKPFYLNQQAKYITGSIGVAQYPEDGDNYTELVKNADVAMYHAKNSGKNQYQKITTNLKFDAQRAIQLTDDLERAIENNEFEVFYQPIVKSQTAEITGLEALLRWKHPDYGYVSPGEFIPLAEKNGLINPIGSWVTQTVAKDVRSWNEKKYKKISIAVNFSVHELMQKDLQSQLQKIIQQNALDPTYLEIEITESLSLGHDLQTINRLNKIEELGITLTIDDYGQGYSSLSRLKDLNISKIKIDMLFTEGIGASTKDEMIIKGLIAFAKSLELTVVVEGVETQEQVNFLNQFENIQLQGYYFYHPMPKSEVEKHLQLI